MVMYLVLRRAPVLEHDGEDVPGPDRRGAREGEGDEHGYTGKTPR